MKKKQIIVSLREELDTMRHRAESAERKLFGEPVWVDADDEEIDFESKYCLARELDCKGFVVPAGTDACLRVMNFTSRKKGIAVEAGNSYQHLCFYHAPLPVIGCLSLHFNLPPSCDNWRDQRLAVPVRKVKDRTIKEN
jgi:hypothetical protein